MKLLILIFPLIIYYSNFPFRRLAKRLNNITGIRQIEEYCVTKDFLNNNAYSEDITLSGPKELMSNYFRWSRRIRFTSSIARGCI